MKTMITVRYNLKQKITAFAIFYVVFLAAMTLMAILAARQGGGSSSGVEMSSAIFLLVMGLNSFKENFYFSQANGVSRRTFFLGALLSSLPLVAFMSALDLIINRVYNLFVPAPMFHDMVFSGGSLEVESGLLYSESTGSMWVPSNEFSVLLSTFLWTLCVYLMVYCLGFFLTLVYYRSGKILKWVVSAVPIILLILLGNFYMYLPAWLFEGIGRFFQTVFFENTYISCLGFLGLALLFSLFAYLLCRRAPIKRS